MASRVKNHDIPLDLYDRPPRNIVFRPIAQPESVAEFQQGLDVVAEKLFGGSLSPDGQKRLLCTWGGEATRKFHNFDVPKYRRVHYKELWGYWFAGDPLSPYQNERKPFYTDETDVMKWPKRWDQYRIRQEVHVTIGEPYALFFVELWLSPEKACVDWNSYMFGAPEPKRGYHYPVLTIGAPETEGNPFGYRYPDSVDLEWVSKIIYEMVTELKTMGKHIDEPMGDSEINHLNYWIAQGLAHETEKESAEFKEYVGDFARDYLATNKKTSFTNTTPHIINPYGGIATRDVKIYVP